MLVADTELSRRAQHTLALDPADLGRFEGLAAVGNDRAHRREYAREPRAGIGRAANDLLATVHGVDLTKAQAVGAGMRTGFDDMGHREAGQGGSAIDDTFDLEAEIGECLGDLIECGIGLEMLEEPGKCELHRESPLWVEGMSSGAKP